MKQISSLPLLTINKPNKNGYFFTKECVENAIKQLKNNEVFMSLQYNYEQPPLKDIVGKSYNFRIEDDKLISDNIIFNEKIIELLTVCGENIYIELYGTYDDKKMNIEGTYIDIK